MGVEESPVVDTTELACQFLRGEVASQLGDTSGLVKEDALKMIEKVRVRGPLEKDTVWKHFLKTFINSSESQSQLKKELSAVVENELSALDQPNEIIGWANVLGIINGGGMGDIVSYHGRIPASVADYQEVINDYFDVYSTGDTERVNLLTDVWDRIKSGQLPLDTSFVVLRENAGKKTAFGARIEQGKLIELGITHIDAPCRQAAFSKLYDSPKSADLGNGMRMITTKDTYDNYPDHYRNPYCLPDELFLLKSSSDDGWGVVNLGHSKIEADINTRLRAAS